MHINRRRTTADEKGLEEFNLDQQAQIDTASCTRAPDAYWLRRERFTAWSICGGCCKRPTCAATTSSS